MRTAAEIHYDYKEIQSDINFLKQEIQFFLKLLSKQYAISVNCCRVKLLDGYWKEFEKYEAKLILLQDQIQNEEQDLAFVSRVSGGHPEDVILTEDQDVYSEYYKIVRNIRTLKESFYNYMSESCQ